MVSEVTDFVGAGERNSVASAGDSTVIIEEPLASATHANLDTRQFSAQYVVQPNMVAPQDLQLGLALVY